MKPLTFLVSFFRSHFKRHETKKFRSTYILPPPTVVWGIVGAVLGVERDGLIDFVKENNLTVGAELCSFKGLDVEKATLMSWDEGERTFIRTVEDFEFLIEPVFRIAIYAKEDLVNELKRRLEEKVIEFDLFGGISDCFLKDLNVEGHAKFERSTNVRGMIPIKLMDGFSEIVEGSRIVRVFYLNTMFYQGYNVEFKTKQPIKTVNGIAVWDFNDVEKFRESY